MIVSLWAVLLRGQQRHLRRAVSRWPQRLRRLQIPPSEPRQRLHRRLPMRRHGLPRHSLRLVPRARVLLVPGERQTLILTLTLALNATLTLTLTFTLALTLTLTLNLNLAHIFITSHRHPPHPHPHPHPHPNALTLTLTPTLHPPSRIPLHAAPRINSRWPASSIASKVPLCVRASVRANVRVRGCMCCICDTGGLPSPLRGYVCMCARVMIVRHFVSACVPLCMCHVSRFLSFPRSQRQ